MIEYESQILAASKEIAILNYHTGVMFIVSFSQSIMYWVRMANFGAGPQALAFGKTGAHNLYVARGLTVDVELQSDILFEIHCHGHTVNNLWIESSFLKQWMSDIFQNCSCTITCLLGHCSFLQIKFAGRCSDILQDLKRPKASYCDESLFFFFPLKMYERNEAVCYYYFLP